MSGKVNLILQPSTGPQGPQGTQGVRGFQGFQGFQGNQGVQGQASTVQGPQGNQGFQGNQGPQGNQGNQGVQGTQGFQGVPSTIAGPQGLKGDQGFQGGQGVQGQASTVAGPQGLKGDQGNQGFQGNQGSQGFQGSQGSQGNQGVQGFQGNQGNQGNQGVAGGAASFRGDWVTSTSYVVDDFVVETVNGIRTQYRCILNHTSGSTTRPGIGASWQTNWQLNIAGVQGPQGNQGNQGTQGTQGVTGAQGSQGNQGNQGSQGAQGNQGNRGFQGFTGSQGAQGSQGSQGNQGFQGLTGSGAQGPQGVIGSQGPQGVRGFQGDQGAQGTGSQGPQGNQGAQGVQGTSASSVVNFTLGENLSGGALVRVVNDSGAKIKGLSETIGNDGIGNTQASLGKKIVKLAENKILTADSYTSNGITLRVHTISGTTTTDGTGVTITTTGDIGQSFITPHYGDNTFVVVYNDGGNTIYHRYGTVSGTTISLGSLFSFTSGSGVCVIDDVCHSGSVAMIVYAPTSSSARRTRKVVGNFAAQAEADPGGSSYTNAWDLVEWGDNAYYLVKLNNTSFQLMAIGSGTLFGSVVTVPEYIGLTSGYLLVNMGANKAAVIYGGGTQRTIKAFVFSGTGTTPTVSSSQLIYDNPYTVMDADVVTDGGAPNSGDAIVFSDAYLQDSNTVGVTLTNNNTIRPHGYLLRISLNGTTLSFLEFRNLINIASMTTGLNLNTRFIPNGYVSNTNNTNIAFVSQRKIVLTGYNRATTNNALLSEGFRVIEYTDQTAYLDDVVGVLQETGTSTQTKPVALLGAVSQAHTGLTIGAVQYVSSTGTITQTPTDRKLGRAIDTTKILLTKTP